MALLKQARIPYRRRLRFLGTWNPHWSPGRCRAILRACATVYQSYLCVWQNIV